MSLSVSFAAREPRCGSSCTSPSAASTLSASRSGVREICEPLAQLALGNPRARRDLAVEQDGADAADDLLMQHGSSVHFECKNG